MSPTLRLKALVSLIVLPLHPDNPHSCLPLTNIISSRPQIRKGNSLQNIGLLFRLFPAPAPSLGGSRAVALRRAFKPLTVCLLHLDDARRSFLHPLVTSHSSTASLPSVRLEEGGTETQFDMSTRDMRRSQRVCRCVCVRGAEMKG